MTNYIVNVDREFSRGFINELERLARICLDVIDSQETPDHGLIANSHMDCRIWAHGILTLLVRKPFRLKGRTVLKRTYDSLVKQLQIPAYDEFRPGQMKALSRVGLAAFCLSQDAFDDISSPDEASKLITDTVLPLACKCLLMEPKAPRFDTN